MIDPDRPVQTRDGRRARIICTDFNNPDFDCPYIALITESATGKEKAWVYDKSGRPQGYQSQAPGDHLVNVRRETLDVHIYYNRNENKFIALPGPRRGYTGAFPDGFNLLVKRLSVEVEFNPDQGLFSDESKR